MTTPRRIQLRRSKGWRKPDGVITVSRPSRFGNPFRVGELAPAGEPIESRDEAVRLFREWITGDPTSHAAAHVRISASLRELRGRDLACWCPLDGPCHADVLIELANDETPRP